MLQEQLFGENLGRLKAGAVGIGSVNGDAGRAKPIAKAQRKRHLRPHDDKPHSLALRQCHKRVDLIRRARALCPSLPACAGRQA